MKRGAYNRKWRGLIKGMQTAFAVTVELVRLEVQEKDPKYLPWQVLCQEPQRTASHWVQANGWTCHNKDLGKSHDLEEAWLPLKRTGLSFP